MVGRGIYSITPFRDIYQKPICKKKGISTNEMGFKNIPLTMAVSFLIKFQNLA